MKRLITIFTISILAASNYINSNAKNINIIFTAALIDNQFEMRKSEYLYSLNRLKSWDYIPYIIESCRRSSFFDNYSVPVCYAQVNDPNLRNKGVNEAKALQVGLDYFGFSDEDMIVKITGRYFFKMMIFFLELFKQILPMMHW